MNRSRAALAFTAILAAGVAMAGAAQAQQTAAQIQGRRDFARIHSLNTAAQGSLRSRAEDAARDARSVVDGSRITCDVTRARFIGYTKQGHDNLLLEVACKQSSGFILDTTQASPRAFDCRILAAGAKEARAAGRKVSRDAVCTLPENVRG